MAKKKAKKYYAIKIGKGVKDKIVNTWGECSKLVLGFNSIYKSFKTKEEAEAYLKIIPDEKIDLIREKNNEAREFNNKRKKSTVSLQGIRLDKELFKEFENKCVELELSKEKAIKLLIQEWIE